MKKNIRCLCALILLAACSQLSAADLTRKPATPQTAAANASFGAALPLAEQKDFANAQRGLVAIMPQQALRDAQGNVVWDTRQFAFIKDAAPSSVNPSLWRQEKLNGMHGLYKVTEGIYQLRSYDLANMTLVEGKSGWILIDPLLSSETAKAALEFAQQTLGRKPVVAVIYTHGHVDHFGGVRGVVSEADVQAGKVRIIAPDGFMESAVAENVLAGNAMIRRAVYQFGTNLPWDEKGTVGSGLGKGASIGSIGLIPPTEIIHKTGQELTVDGVRIVFQMANGSEAPAEFTFYFPDLKALCLSEVVTQNMHNIYTLRGAKTRDALGWSKYINEMLDVFPDAEVAFRSHHWPVWGKDSIRKHLVNQRDTYRFLHDEALHLANQGATMAELGNALFIPKGLDEDLSTHGYYGTLSHNLRAVYNFYLGFYDGNPANLHPLPRVESARRYVAAMGGAAAVLAQGRKSFEAGDYRWTVEAVNHLVFAEPANVEARELQANALEQLGYQAESAVWRNEYLTAASELRSGVEKSRTSSQGPDLVRAMPLEMIFDFLSVRLDHRKVDGKKVDISLVFTDTKETWALELSNSVLSNTRGRVLPSPDVTLTLTRAALFKMLLAKEPLPKLLLLGEVKLSGNPFALATVFSNIVDFDPQFRIVSP